jgi:hypothetical protein
MDLVEDYRKIFKPGMKVRINDICVMTSNKWTLVYEMKEMRGGLYSISSVDIDRVVINGYIWCGEDLTIEDDITPYKDIEKSKDLKLEVVTFNPNDLVL